jgi:hypothetical protein
VTSTGDQAAPKQHNGKSELSSRYATNDMMLPLQEQDMKNQTQGACCLGVDSGSGVFRVAERPFSRGRQTRLASEQSTHKTKGAMNREIKSYKPVFVINDDTPKVKKLDLQITVTDRDLGNEVKKVFDLARIAGQELDIVFSHATS